MALVEENEAATLLTDSAGVMLQLNAAAAELLEGAPEQWQGRDLATLLDPVNCGPATIGLCQDVQAEAGDFPDAFFAPRIHRGDGRRNGRIDCHVTGVDDDRIFRRFQRSRGAVHVAVVAGLDIGQHLGAGFGHSLAVDDGQVLCPQGNTQGAQGAHGQQ